MTGSTGCADPVIRAATLLATPYAFRLSVPDESPETCPIGAVVGTAPILLVPPGPTAEAIRQEPREAMLEGLARCVAQDGGLRSHALLEIGGTVHPVPADRRGAVAVALYDNLGREELLDAVVDHEWLLAQVYAEAATWHLPQACVPVDLTEVATARIDEVLRHSTRVCPRLNLDHPEIAEAVAGEPAWFIEVDRFGATLGLHDRQEEVRRVHWHRPCEWLQDLHVAIAHSPLPRADDHIRAGGRPR